MKTSLTYLCSIVLFFLACSHGFSVSSNIARISDEKFEAHENPIDVFFEDTKPDEEYFQIALIDCNLNSAEWKKI